MVYLILICFGCLAGISSVLFGFGGGFVVVPLLYITLNDMYGTGSVIGHEAIHIAVATSTCVMIVSATFSTLKHNKLGNILWEYIFPFAFYIAISSICGAIVTSFVQSKWVHYAFLVYLAATIMDCILRSGFTDHDIEEKRSLNKLEKIGGGLGIGFIGTFIGVGGGVMTVPLLRRKGLSMTQATAMANPLSLAVALSGTLTYIAFSIVHPLKIDGWFIGYIDLPAFAVLTISSLLGIQIATKFIGKIPDKIHAQVYIFLLFLVMLSMIYK